MRLSAKFDGPLSFNAHRSSVSTDGLNETGRTVRGIAPGPARKLTQRVPRASEQKDEFDCSCNGERDGFVE